MKKRKLKPGKLYWVEWRDAFSGPNTWQSEEDLEDLMSDDYIVWTTGWLQKETEHYFLFCSTVAQDRTHRTGVFAVPKGMITRIEEVSYG